jgi:hypothetical protein
MIIGNGTYSNDLFRLWLSHFAFEIYYSNKFLVQPRGVLKDRETVMASSAAHHWRRVLWIALFEPVDQLFTD